MQNHVNSRGLLALIACGVVSGCSTGGSDGAAGTRNGDDPSAPSVAVGLAQGLVFPDVRSGLAVFHREEPSFQPVVRTRFAPLADSVDEAHLARMRVDVGPGLRDVFGHTGLPLGPKALNNKDVRVGRERVRWMLQRMEADLPGFLRWLRDGHRSAGLAPPPVTQLHHGDNAMVEWRKRYYTFLMALLDLNVARDEARLLAGERLLRFMVGDATHEKHAALIARESDLPLAILFCEATWKGLSSTGWRLWRWETLEALRRRSEAGHEVVYIAGGSDVFQLLVNGVRRIRIVDPMFPVQAPYYCKQWPFLLRGRFRDGGIGDRIVIEPFPVKTPTGVRRSPTVVLTRTRYTESGVIDAGTMNDGSTCRLATGETVWRVDADDGRPSGTLVFERRFATQADLVPRPDRVLLVSFNELYFLVTPHEDDSWGIDPRRFDPTLRLYVKQLREPMSVKEMLRLRAQLASKRYECVMGTEVR